MTAIVSRSCKEITKDGGYRSSKNALQSLDAFRSAPAYVLLGEPGAGKTTAFKSECHNIEDNHYITAHDFIAYQPSNHPEWRGKTLFIDGLDEVRATRGNAQVPFEAIRSRLDEMGKPRFRLSCREADWLGEIDRKKLEDISPDNKVVMLSLDPLTDSDVSHILRSMPKVEDAQEFIGNARQLGIEGLLENPQSLNMLVAAVTGDHGWPHSRLETFELACREMTREHNEEHSNADQAIAEGVLADPDQLLDAAGRLCALMLISGAAGFARNRNEESADFPAWGRCEYEHAEHLKSALSTKLFKALKVESASRFTPVHRHIAEYLGARHLYRIISGRPDRVGRNGLPARRVISLLTGEDGMVVSEIRGLSAWLAAHCTQARRELIVRDPTGVGLYGDIQRFMLDDKRELLMALKHQVSGLPNIYHAAPAFAGLATTDMEPVLREVLVDPNPAKANEEYLDFVLCVLGYGERLESLSDVLFEIVCDNKRSSWVNRSALIAFMHNCPESDKTGKLETLLEEIETGSVQDSENEMLGKALTHLYPEHLPPSRIWDYLRESALHIGIGMYESFWRDDLLEQSSVDQVAELLDSLVERLPGLYPAIKTRQAGDVVMDLLLKGLVNHGGTICIQRLYDWLGIGSPNFEHRLGDRGDSRFNISTWLEQHPRVCKSIIIEGLNRCPDSDDFWSHAFNVQMRLYHATLPRDYGVWCLDQAALSDTKPRIAEFLREQAMDAHRYKRNNEGLSLELLKQHASKNEAFKERLDEWLSMQSVREETPKETSGAINQDVTIDRQFDRRQKKLPERYRKAIEQRQKKTKRWLDHIHANEDALRENRAAPGFLYDLAKIYFGPFFDFKSKDGLMAVKENLQDDPGLMDAVLVGLRGTVDREDIPNVDDIMRHNEIEKRYYTGLPYLAGLAELERTMPENAGHLSDDQARKALAFYYTEARGHYRPEWFKRLRAARPKLVADVYIRYTLSELKRASNTIQDIDQLSSNPDYVEVTKIASIPLLKAFPTRCRSEQLEILEHLLTAAIRYADRSSLRSLVVKKASRRSMNVAQRARWLAAGLIVSPGMYHDSVESFIGTGRGRVSRIYDLMSLLHPGAFESLRFRGPRISDLKLLIRLVGRDVEPVTGFDSEEFDEDGESMGGMVSNVMSVSFSVRAMIDRLADDPKPEATDALESLLVDDTLAGWHAILGSRLHTQRRIRRDAAYHRLTIEQVSQTLRGGTPANAGDLAALVMDRLGEIATDTKDGVTNNWRIYWNEDSNGRPNKPKREESCRDALLSNLQLRLPDGVIAAQPEGQYARNKRSDIRIAYADFQVPLEIKKNSHRKLWSAMHRQLIEQYVRDPSTDGYGIYLVFWFGEKCTQPPPSGKRPDNPQELQALLESDLSPEEARKISVCVIDVSSDLKTKWTSR